MMRNFLMMVAFSLAALLSTTPQASFAEQVGDLDAPFTIPTGQFVIVAPPQGTDKGKPVVFSSTPPSRWTPYLSYDLSFASVTFAECDLALEKLRLADADRRVESMIERFKKENAAKDSVAARDAEKVSMADDLHFVLLNIHPDLDAPYER